MAQIPNDVIYSLILPRLPVKSLTRFKCVSKSWQTLISSPDFIRLHRRHALSSDANRRIISEYHSSTHFVAYDLDSPLDEPRFYPYPKPETLVSSVTATIVASCDFFVLVRIGRILEQYTLVLINPSTYSYREIPCPYSTKKYLCQTFGICLDETNGDDYKVIMIERYLHGLQGIDIEIMMYSSVTNSWRLIGHDSTPGPFVCLSFNNFVIINKLLYITFGSIYPGNVTKKYVRIGCFDIQAEQWTADIPSPDNNLCTYSYNLRLLDGSLCVLGNDKKNDSFHVWVMKDCWVKLMSIDITDHSNRSKYYPIAYQRRSRHELLCRRHHEFCQYNLREKVATHVAFDKNLGNTCRSTYQILYHIDHVCRESLVTFPNKLQNIVPMGINTTPCRRRVQTANVKL